MVWKGRYSAYGQLLEAWTPPDDPYDHPQPKVNNPLRFQGQYEDPESGLHYNLNRYYDPGIAYVEGNPVGWVDPLGLKGMPGADNKPTGDRNPEPVNTSVSRENVLNNIQRRKNARESSNFKNYNEWPPNRGFYSEPAPYTLLPGARIDRYGHEYGTFVSPQGEPYRSRALKPGSDGKPYSVYEVKKPITVNAGEAAPWFGYEGMGMQFELKSKVIDLIDDGSLKRIKGNKK